MSDSRISINDAYVPFKAENGKFVVVSQEKLADMGYLSGGSAEGRYAVLTYQLNPTNITLSGETVNVNVSAIDVDNWNDLIAETYTDQALSANVSVQNWSSLISQTSTFPLSTIATVYTVAVTGVPTAVADGSVVRPWVDEYGRLVTFGDNLSLNAKDVNIVNPVELITLEGTDLNAVTASGAAVDVDVSNYNKMTYHVTSTNVTSGATIKLQSSLDGVSYANIATLTVIASGVDEIAVENRIYKYLRPNITQYIDGTYTVKHIFGR